MSRAIAVVAICAAVTVALRPEKIHLSRKPQEDGFNSVRGTIKEMSYFGSFSVYHYCGDRLLAVDSINDARGHLQARKRLDGECT